MHVLNVYRKTEKPAQALRAVNLARNTLRDFLRMVELKIIDERKYDETIAKGAPAARETFCERF